MTRACFTLQVRPDRIDEYAARHAQVWPEMLAALGAAGWGNYSLHLRDDGLLVGYVETDDLEAAQAAMEVGAAGEVNARWQAEMAELFVGLDGAAPDQGFVRLREVFHLQTQLAEHRSHPEPDTDTDTDTDTRQP